LKIVHLNTFDIAGGAARAAYNLHKGMRRMGFDSSMLVAHRDCRDSTVSAFTPSASFSSRLGRRMREKVIARSISRYRTTRPRGLERFSDDRTVYGKDLVRHLQQFDIINLHWIAQFVDYREFFSNVPRRLPVFWRLSDMNPLTGGCHFDANCGRYNSGCGSCPQIGSTDEKDLSHQIWQRKLQIFNKLEADRLHIVALNRWMAEIVRRSPLLGKFPVTIIPNGVATDIFSPRDVRLSRDVLGIPQGAKVVLFGAEIANNRRKGFYLLAEALKDLPHSGTVVLLSVGQDSPQIDSSMLQINLGNVHDDRLLSLIYSAADVYVVPSIQDNQPNTVLEAMACGTPVIGFDVGGIPDMVRSGENGLLIPEGDVKALRQGIAELLDCAETRAAMAAASRRIVMEEYTRELQVRRYVELYEKALSIRNGTASTPKESPVPIMCS
jgi:glycosyltransferase involved in cell wall biosynthesis